MSWPLQVQAAALGDTQYFRKVLGSKDRGRTQWCAGRGSDAEAKAEKSAKKRWGGMRGEVREVLYSRL